MRSLVRAATALLVGSALIATPAPSGAAPGGTHLVEIETATAICVGADNTYRINLSVANRDPGNIADLESLAVLPDDSSILPDVTLGPEGSGSSRAIIRIDLPGLTQSAVIRMGFAWSDADEIQTSVLQRVDLDGRCDPSTPEDVITEVRPDRPHGDKVGLEAIISCQQQTGRHRVEWAVENLSDTRKLTLDFEDGFGIVGNPTTVVTHKGQQLTTTLQLDPRSRTFVEAILPANGNAESSTVLLDVTAAFEGIKTPAKSQSRVVVPNKPCVPGATPTPTSTSATPEPGPSETGGQPEPSTASPTGDGGALPVTGFAAGGAVTVAVVVLAVGAFLLLAGRRRRLRDHEESAQ